jgi:hypothetical protein
MEQGKENVSSIGRGFDEQVAEGVALPEAVPRANVVASLAVTRRSKRRKP